MRQMKNVINKSVLEIFFLSQAEKNDLKIYSNIKMAGAIKILNY